MNWLPHVVRQGDFLDALAFRCGTEPETIWQAEDNRELRDLRSDPNQLCPGDVIYLPPTSHKVETIRAEAENDYASEIRQVEVELDIETHDETGAIVPVANAECTIEGGGVTLSGQTSAEGHLAFSVPIYVQRVSVYVEPIHTTLLVKIGHIDDHRTLSGIGHRLGNLGYLVSEEAGDTELYRDFIEAAYHQDDVAADASQSRAVARFRRDQGMDEGGGPLSDEDLETLRRTHGS